MSDAVVRLQAESGEAALSCRPEGMSEGPDLQEEAGLLSCWKSLPLHLSSKDEPVRNL